MRWKNIMRNKNATIEKLMIITSTFKSSKKTSLQQEMIIQVGDRDDFSSGENFEKQMKFYRNGLKVLKNEIQI